MATDHSPCRRCGKPVPGVDVSCPSCDWPGPHRADAPAPPPPSRPTPAGRLRAVLGATLLLGVVGLLLFVTLVFLMVVLEVAG